MPSPVLPRLLLPFSPHPVASRPGAASWDHDRKNDYEFYPGSGKEDIVQSNIINVPIAPLWRKSESAHSTRRATRNAYSMYQGFGRAEFRRKINDRLLPSMRAFNPDLILLSSVRCIALRC